MGDLWHLIKLFLIESNALYIIYTIKKFKVYYTSIRSARYVFVFLQSKFLKEKRSGFQSEFGVSIQSSDRIGTKILSLNKEKKRKKNENDKTVKYV